jgi:RNA polymerase sigma-70 factor (ECF subfamily)
MGELNLALPADFDRFLAEVAAVRPRQGQTWLLRLMHKHSPGVVRTLWRMLGNEHDVLDVYQDTICRLAQFDERHSIRQLKAYFYRTAINRAAELMRSRRLRHSRQELLIRMERHKWQAEHAATVHSPLEHLELVQQLRAAIAQLPRHLRDVIILRDLAELSYRQVASILEITPGTAKVYRCWAVRQLAEAMNPEGDAT